MSEGLSSSQSIQCFRELCEDRTAEASDRIPSNGDVVSQRALQIAAGEEVAGAGVVTA